MDMIKEFEWRAFTPTRRRNALAMSLFWKNPDISDPDMAPITPAIVESGECAGAKRNFHRYLSPIKAYGRLFHERHRDWEIVIFLAADLAFLRDELLEIGCRVVSMKTSSIRHSPGAMWRFLIADMGYDQWCCSDIDENLEEWSKSVRFSDLMIKNKCVLWRIPACKDLAIYPDVTLWSYKAIQAGHFGGCKGFRRNKSMFNSIAGFNTSDANNPEFKHPSRGILRRFGSTYPAYGFDEFFLHGWFVSEIWISLEFNSVLTVIPKNCEIGLGAARDFAVTGGVYHVD